VHTADDAAEGANGVTVLAAGLGEVRAQPLLTVSNFDVDIWSVGVHLLLLGDFSARPAGLTLLRVLV
jgi:hypothetical protein